MERRLNTGITALVTAWCLFASGTVSAALRAPDCGALQQWSAALSPGKTFEPRPGVTVTTLLEDRLVVPLFGAPVTAWRRTDLSSVQRLLTHCRRQALGAKNREAGNSLYAALKAVKQASRNLRKLWRAHKQVERQVASLLRLRPDPNVPEILSIAQAALQGRDTQNRVAALPPRWQGYGRQAAGLQTFGVMLSPGEIQPWLEQLEQKRREAAASINSRREAHQALLAEVAAVPVTPAGMGQLNRIVYKADPGRMNRTEQESFNRAVQSKRQQIRRVAVAHQAKVKRDMATLPAPMKKVVAAVLMGDSAEDASLHGIRTGISYAEIKRQAKRLWDYGEALTLGNPGHQLSTKRRDFNRLMRDERRDGGLLNVQTHQGVVGKVSYVEHFPGPANIAPLQTELEARFGKPDEVIDHEDGSRSLVWHGRDHHLRVRAGNRVTPSRSYMGVRSSVEITLWTQEFAEYRAQAKTRCARLRDTPVSELSINERQAILTGCLSP